MKAVAAEFPACLLAAEAAATAPADECASLLTGVRRGKEGAFTELHARLAFPLYQRLLAITHGEEALCRELVQAAMLQLARRCPAPMPERALLAWLLRVARHHWIDQLRRRQREGFVPLEGFEEAAPGAGPLADLLREILAALPPAEGELLHAAYVDERPLAEIAAERGLTYKALEGRLGRLRATVRSRLLRLLRDET